jgi:hypothetical protein
MKVEGLDAILAEARRRKLPWQIGISLAEIVMSTETEHQLLERTLAAPDANERKLGRGYAVRAYSIKGPRWAEQFLRSDVFKSWPPTKQADFCLGLPEEPSTWHLVSHLGTDMRSGKVNQQGVTTRDPLEGGRRERETAKTYRNWAKAVAAKWHNTARLLNSLAQTYEGYAGMHDISAENLDLEY